jgi:hypothetical protein
MNKDPERLLQDPLREVTRKERRTLLGVATTGIVVVLMGLEPIRISAFDIAFAAIQYKRLLLVWGVIVLYFLIVFITYAASDFIAWRLTLIDNPRNWEIDNFEREKVEQDRLARLRSQSQTEEQHLIGINERIKADEREETYSKLTNRYQRPSQVISWFRMVVDFFLPLLTGIVAIVLLLRKWAC